jgi:hypothetical protein
MKGELPARYAGANSYYLRTEAGPLLVKKLRQMGNSAMVASKEQHTICKNVP